MAKKQINPKLNYFLTGLKLLLFNLVFSLMSLVFIADLHAAIKIIAGIVFLAPIVIIFFILGKGQGEAYYKGLSKSQPDNKPKMIEIKWYKSLFHLISYVALPLLLLIIAMMARRTGAGFFMRGMVYFLYFPVSLIFEPIKLLNMDYVSLTNMLIYIPAMLVFCGMFVLGYMLQVLKLKKQQANIESELRSFNN